ncbi:PucR family transcriptional regulator [Marinactinospora rubrisoli]|uniref:PucR family transcriptional regulator n=1 Tax=Marinactinospora rubrisoli TaxID=2715399 RepID=A0ABW2KNX5_9ACTN
MQISDLVAIPRLRLRFLAGAEHAGRPLRAVYTTDLLRPERYLRGGELVLTGMMWRTGAADSDTFVRALTHGGAACLGAGAALGEVPADLVEACRRHGLPLVEVPAETSFGAVTEEVTRSLASRRTTALAQHRDRRRRLITDLAGGADLAEVFAPAARHAGVTAWVLSCTGRTVAAAGPDLPAAERELLARRHLVPGAFPRRVELPAACGAARPVTLFPVRTRDTHPLAGWFLACAGDHTTWSEETRDAVAELVSFAVLARGRDEERAVVDARHAEGLPRLLAAQRFDEVAELLSAAGRAPGRRAGAYVPLSVALRPEPRPAGLTRRIAAELVADWPGAVITQDGGDDAALAVVPVGGAAGPDAERLHAAVSAGVRVLESGLTDRRLAIGIAAMTREPAALRGAAVEARHARRLAELRGGRARVVAGAEIDSHELLLASVPEEVQSSYRERLLEPLVDYDRGHRSDLVATLEAFLRHSGSWQRCAASMHVHVNTLRYRIGRIEELTGRDLSSLEHRVDLFLALKLRG